jgi:hypothetical protein
MTTRYVLQNTDGALELHLCSAEEDIPLPEGAVKLTQAEYDSIALGRATLVKGKVKTL